MNCEGIFHALINNFLNVFSKNYSGEKFITIWPRDIGGGGSTRLVTNRVMGGGNGC